MDERTERKRGTMKFEHRCSLYADDAALFFDSRDGFETAASFLYEQLLKFGLKMHVVKSSY
jgi:hypothetical protein